jgi:hypothetical protein
MTSMRKLLIAFMVLAAAGCDDTRRDFSYCDDSHGCQSGYQCNPQGMCVPEQKDAGAVRDTAPDSPDGPPDLALAPTDRFVPDAAPDLPPVVDAPLAVDRVDQAGVDIAASVDEGTEIDLVRPVDLAPPDTRVPDTAGTCSVDNDCIGVAKSPYCVGNRCVSCEAPAAGGGSLCSGKTPACNADTGTCVECTANSHCSKDPAKAFCANNTCAGCDDPAARASAGGADAGVGDGGVDDGGVRDGGVADSGTSPTAACLGGTVCMPSNSGNSKAGQCVGCRGDGDCTSPGAPICDTSKSYTCGACSTDDQCAKKGVGPGICMLVKDGAFQHDGTCATDAETIYVQNSTGCSGGAGTAVSPYCQPQSAVSAVTTSKRLIVMSGSAPLAVWSASFGVRTQPVYVVGRGNPTISVGAADIGIHIVSGSVYVRGLTVQGSGVTAVNPGILVEAGATLGLDRCYVMGNAGGVLVSDGAGFDIGNNVLAQNQSGGVGAAVFGGAYLGSSTDTTLPHRFWFNTIADNLQFGLACASKQQTIDGCLLSGDTGGEVVNCTLAATTKSPNRSPSGTAGTGFSTDNSPPLFSAASTAKPYHLTGTASRSTSSPCKDFITDITVAFPADDIDGQSRPYGSAIDCGADEYWP